MVVLGLICLLVATKAVPHPLAGVTPLPKAHSHNDYNHARPLWDALEHGFTSIEADVFLVDGELLIGHEERELSAGRTLQSLYLDPLRELVDGRGAVYEDGSGIVLLVDVKSNAVETYEKLHDLLAGYAQILTRWEEGVRQEAAVTVIVSGNRAVNSMRQQSPRYAACDGRLADLTASFDPDLMPLVSDAWQSHFAWSGSGTLPPGEHDKLRRIVERVHSAGARLRFWGAPDRQEAWAALRDAHVDLINTDDLPGLSAFLKETPAEDEEQ